jgi:NhaP-type Na+/H+ or K+/H+ antiporter
VPGDDCHPLRLGLPGGPYIPRKFSRRLRQQDPSPPWQNVTVIAYAGMRGAVSLAAALALPFTLPDRDLVIFLTFSVIFVTLVVQGLTLPPLIRWPDLQDDSAPEEEETIARLQAAEAALERIEGLEDEE